MIKVINFIKRNTYWSIIGSLVFLLVIYLVFFAKSEKLLKTYPVARGDVVSEVSVTGKVKPAQSLDLAFEKSGRVLKVNVKVGDNIREGQILASLDNSEFYAQFLQAQASVKTEKAKLDELKAGTRPEDIQVKRSELEKSKQDLISNYSDIPTILSDSYNKADDAVRKQIDDLFINDEDSNPQLTFRTANNQNQIDAQNQRYQASATLNKWKGELDLLDTATTSLDKAITNSENYLVTLRTMLDKAMQAVIDSTDLLQATKTIYKTDINTARTNINSALTSINTEEQSIASQKIYVQKIQDELNLKLAGTVPEQITAQEARLDQANANVRYYESQIAKTLLIAPFSGIITKVDIDPGDISQTNISAVSLIGKGAYEIESNITETDIARVKIGNLAKVTLDAYGLDLIFKAKVVKIDLSATIIEGVATYKTTLQFLEEDSRILSGLTANIDIKSDERKNVLYVLNRDVRSEDGKKFVKILSEDNKIKDSEITIGLKGSDGRVEVASGLKEGDKIYNE